jgi:fibronectin-binding autotransporter adhesin
LFRLTSSLHASGRARTIYAAGLALAAFLVFAAWSSSARASGCTNTFTNAAGGSWYTASNWSKGKIPSSTEEACITEPGTYTVEMAQGPAVTVKTLTVGGASGTQTLSVQSTSSANASLTTSEGLAIGAHGVVTMTNNVADKDENGVTLVGPITNAGTLASEKGNGSSGGNRSIQGNVTNTGTLAIDHTTEYNGASTTLTNEGTLDLAEGTTLHVTDKSGVVNGSGGKIAATGSAVVLVSGSETSFTQGAGTTSGTLPVIVDDSALKYTGSGASSIAIRGTSTLAGNISAGQSLVIQSTSGENANVTAGASFSNAGSIALTNAADSDENSETLVIAKGDTLTNSGTLASEKGNGSSGGSRSVQGNVTNTGTLAIDHTTEYNGESATLANEGTLDLAEGTTLHVTDKSGVVNGSGGKIAGTGSGTVFVQGSGTSFTQGAGTTSGTLPVIVDDSALTYTGSGASSIAVRGTITLAGNISAGQSLVIQSTSGENANVTAGASFSNAGSIVLTNAADSDENSETLVIAKGETLTNSGTLTTEKGNGTGGNRTIQGNVTNTGTLALDHSTEYDGESGHLLNEGTIAIANEVSLNATDSSVVVNGTGGNIEGVGSGVLSQRSGTFEEGAGKTTGTLPVVLDDLALKYTGDGTSTLALRGSSTLSGTISKGQTLSLQSTSGENANITAASFTNNGKLVLANADDGDGNNVTLNLSGGTLTNTSKKGVIEAEVGHGGGRTIEGNLVNEGTVGTSGTLRVTGSFTEQGKKPVFKTTVSSTGTFGELVATGPATILGELAITQAKPTFVPTVGQKFGIISSSALTGTFSKLKGNKIKKSAAKVYEPIYSGTGVALEAQA